MIPQAFAFLLTYFDTYSKVNILTNVGIARVAIQHAWQNIQSVCCICTVSLGTVRNRNDSSTTMSSLGIQKISLLVWSDVHAWHSAIVQKLQIEHLTNFHERALKVTWKQTAEGLSLPSPNTTVRLHLDELRLAWVLHKVHLNMFQHENV